MKHLFLAIFCFLTISMGAQERTYSMIKPLAVQEKHVGAIIDQIEKSGLNITALQLMQLSPETVAVFYQEHKDKPFFNDLVSTMSNRPIVAIVIEGDNAVKRMRDLVGATDPKKAANGTIRAQFGVNVTNNAIHASDSPESAKREIALIFKE